jgi:GMP synthase (glutamine-hydrolysing)
MVTDRLAWSEKTAAWIRSAMAVEMPLFGICYGHQLMADALGGEVAYHPAGRETGCKAITLSAAGRTDPLLSDRPAHFPRTSAICKRSSGCRRMRRCWPLQRTIPTR